MFDLGGRCFTHSICRCIYESFAGVIKGFEFAFICVVLGGSENDTQMGNDRFGTRLVSGSKLGF